MRLTSCLLRVGPEVSSTFSYERLLKRFPPKINFAFAYGSGFFQQKNNEDVSEKMLDFIFVVEDSFKWHTENLKSNNDHYALAGKLSSSETVHNWMDKSGAGVHFNTGILEQGRKIKYGVISEENLVKDLKNWETLYISGRLHKPVHVIRHDFEHSPQLLTSLKHNLASCLATSLLLLPDSFTEKDLYLTITGLSYMGDVRMGIAEDQNKISNIVEANLIGFRNLYTPLLNSFSEIGVENSQQRDLLHWNQQNNMLIQDKTPANIHDLVQQLPRNLIFEMCCAYDREAKHIRDIDEIAKSMAKYPDVSELIRTALNNIVSQSSKSQTLKNMATVGPLEAVKYSSQKISKMIKSLAVKNN